MMNKGCDGAVGKGLSYLGKKYLQMSNSGNLRKKLSLLDGIRTNLMFHHLEFYALASESNPISISMQQMVFLYGVLGAPHH